ncbi:uncharacterized protein LOC144428258 [Styela clava]
MAEGRDLTKIQEVVGGEPQRFITDYEFHEAITSKNKSPKPSRIRKLRSEYEDIALMKESEKKKSTKESRNVQGSGYEDHHRGQRSNVTGQSSKYEDFHREGSEDAENDYVLNPDAETSKIPIYDGIRDDIIQSMTSLNLNETDPSETASGSAVPMNPEDRSWSSEDELEEIYNNLDRGRPFEASYHLDTLKGKIWTSSQIKIDDVMKMFDNHMKNYKYIDGLILLSFASKLYKRDLNPDDAMKAITQCSSRFHMFAHHYGRKLRKVYRDFLMQISFEFLTDLRSVTGASADLKAIAEANCLNHIGANHDEFGNYLEAIEAYQEGIQILESHFSSDAAKYQILGHLYRNKASTYVSLGKYSKAEKLLATSRDCYGVADDWESKGQKSESFHGVEKDVLLAREAMKQRLSALRGTGTTGSD